MQDVEIAQIAAEQGWQVAAHDHMRALDPRGYRLAVDEYGAQLRVLLPLTPDSTVLQLRCGWGSVALGMADCTGSVLAVDDRLPRLRFLGARRTRSDAANVHLICATPGAPLPLPDRACDAVILLDVLEHVPARSGAGDVPSQHAVLLEALRVLKPEGWFLLGVANRLAPTGSRDGAGNHTRLYWAYRWALQRAGFRGMEFFAPLPSYKEPFFILPLDHWRVVDHFVDQIFTAQDYRSKLEERGLGPVYSLARAAWQVGRRLRLSQLARYVVPSYLILARS